MRKLMTIAAILVVCDAASLRAEESGPTVSLRVAYGLPGGKAADDLPLSEAASRNVPLWLDVGYRVSAYISAGVYASYGLVHMTAENTCTSSLTCSAKNARLGVEGFYHLMPADLLDAYAGAGIGYEWMNFKVANPNDDSLDFGYRGFELNLHGGGDFSIMPGVTIGPFATLSIGQYSSTWMSTSLNQDSSEWTSGTTISQGIGDDKTLHYWFHFGVRATYNI